MNTNNLRELTRDSHKRAEKTKFIHKLIKSELTPYQYYVYLTNQFMIYSALEQHASDVGLLSGITEIKRAMEISKDLRELELEYSFSPPEALNSTLKYIKYLYSIHDEPNKILAHIYVRHMGDLSGGQIIKKFVPGSGKYYIFDSDVGELKEKLRKKLNDTMAIEANKCFDLVYEFTLELEKFLGIVE